MKIKKLVSFLLIVLGLILIVPANGEQFGCITTVYAKNGFNKKPNSKVGFKENPKTKSKVKAPGSNDYGYKDSKGRVWVPDGKMHGGKGWTRVYPDGSHDHVYEDGNVRVHKSKSTSSGKNWIVLAAIMLLFGVAVFSPIPGDEIVVGGALLGV